MVKWIETTGRTEEDAISAALFQLGLERDDVSIEVLVRARTGFLGFGSNPAKVRVRYEVEYEGGKPMPINFFQEKDILASVWDTRLEEETPEEKPAPKAEKPAPKAEPKSAKRAEEKKEKPAPAPAPKPEPKPVAEEPGEAVEEETILAAKPGWQPARPAHQARNARQGRPQASAQSQSQKGQAPRSESRRDRSRGRKNRSPLQDGDEVLIGAQAAPPERPAPVERPPHHEPILSPVSEDDEKANRIRDFLTGLMEHLEVQAEPEIMITDEGNYKVKLLGGNLGTIIGRRGETLDAIQQLTSYAVNRGQSKRVRIHVDAEGYRAKREESLQRLAVKMAGKVVRYHRRMTLEPMNAYERHVIHASLQDYPNVTTYSIGVEPNRRTVVDYDPSKKVPET